MNTEAATIEPPPSAAPASSTPTPSGKELMPGLAEAAQKHDAFLKGDKPPAQRQQPPAKVEKAEPAKKEPAAKADATPGGGAIDKLKPRADKPVKAEPAAKTEPAKKEGAEDEKSQARWQQLKDAEAELQRIKPDYDASKAEKAAWEKERKEWEAERKELEELRKVRDFTDITKSKRYQDEVETPFQKIGDQVAEVAEYASMDTRALMNVLKEPNALVRAKTLKAFIEEHAKQEVPQDIITKLVLAGDEMKEIGTRMATFKEQATQEKKQWETQQAAEKLRVETETNQIKERARKEAADILKTNAHDVITEDMLNSAMERSKVRRSEPMDDAFRDVSEYLVPELVEVARARQQRIEELEEENAELRGAKPGIKPDKDKGGERKGTYASLAEATEAHKAGRHSL